MSSDFDGARDRHLNHLRQEAAEQQAEDAWHAAEDESFRRQLMTVGREAAAALKSGRVPVRDLGRGFSGWELPVPFQPRGFPLTRAGELSLVLASPGAEGVDETVRARRSEQHAYRFKEGVLYLWTAGNSRSGQAEQWVNYTDLIVDAVGTLVARHEHEHPPVERRNWWRK